MIAAIGAQAVMDVQTTARRLRHDRADARAFFQDGRFDVVCRLVGGISIPAAKSRLMKRGLMGVWHGS